VVRHLFRGAFGKPSPAPGGRAAIEFNAASPDNERDE